MGDLRGVGVTPSFNQSSVSNNSTPCEQVDTSGHVFFMVIYSLMFVVGLILNGFTLKVYFCRPQQLTTSSMTIYLKNLAAADFLTSLSLPNRIMTYASSSVPIFQVFCSFGASAFCMNMYASILFMGYIAANRYLKIVHPLGTHSLGKVRPAHIISTVTWVFLLTTHLPQAVAGTAEAASVLQQQKLAKSRRNMLVLVSVFCVCLSLTTWLAFPSFLLSSQCSHSRTFFYMSELTIMVSALNVCLDPLIYFIFSKDFRAQLGLTKLFRTTTGPNE
ncbi:P2Y purinoceptor 14 [Larimichthys crocea]|uniref:P2Y purinoceptor 14 n=1 Tax=Larimichthys crocea TaxID=215358 RepID=A0A6G0IU43_LARCR|nr:P2Y purinoceptor 14 [Larimichthys crocea]